MDRLKGDDEEVRSSFKRPVTLSDMLTFDEEPRYPENERAALGLSPCHTNVG